MLKTLGGIALSGVLPSRGKKENPAHFEPAQMVIPAPKAELVHAYAQWSGADPSRYTDILPPHLLSQWALPAASRVLRQSRYEIARVINQGVDMVVNGTLPLGEDILVQARLASLSEENNRARVSVEILSGTSQQPDAVVATLHVTFILGPKQHSGTREVPPEPAWETVGQWETLPRDGLNFALLTGDFNPIHWIDVAGKMSPFKAKVLHGFGMFVRTYEVLAQEGPVRSMGVRFLKPVPLPSPPVRVQQGPKEADGTQRLRLIAADDALHMAGHFVREG